MPPGDEFSQLRAAPTRAGREVLDRLLPAVYDQLRRVAHRQLRGEGGDHTLGTTGLVHEAYLRLSDLDRLEWRSRAHFFAVAAQAMRRILVDYANSRKALKRGGTRRKVALDEVALPVDLRADEVLALDEALDRLSAVNARYARVVECRFFGGLDIEETAEALDISPATVKRDWTMARAWLNRELST